MPVPGRVTTEAVAPATGGAPIDIELELPSADVPRVFRHRAVSAGRRGRTRSTDTAITWHDAPPDAGARPGALLAREAAGWTLQRTLRRDGWPVGLETLPVAASDGVDAPGVRAVAALHGRTRRVELVPEGDAAAPVTVSLLQGSLRNVTGERPWCRVRVHGEAAVAGRLALRLGETLPLVPCTLSLTDAAAAMGHAGLAAPDPPAISIAAEGDVDAALAAVFGSLSAALVFWMARLRAPTQAGGLDAPAGGFDPDAVHAARVATRRLRSAVTLFREPLGGSLDALRAPLAALGGLLGRLRDWDVFLGETGASVVAGLGADAAGSARMAALLRDAERCREEVGAEVGRALARPAVRRLLLHLSLLSALRPWREAMAAAGGEDRADGADSFDAATLGRPIRTLAPRLVDGRYRKLVAAGKHLRGLDAVTLHEVRKTAKKLRYTLEFLGPTQPRGETRRLLRRLATLQDQLGALNDTAAAVALLARVARPGGPHDWAAGLVTGWLAAKAADAGEALGETWHAVRHTGRFWRG